MSELVAGLRRELIINGLVWYYLAAFAIDISVASSIAIGSWIIVKRRNDITLVRILRQNGRRDWRTALLQLCGVILPPKLSLGTLKSKSLILSILAFCVEGASLYVYFHAGDNLLKLSQSSKLPFPGSISPTEGHYYDVVTIAFFVVPIAFVFTQITFSGAGRIQRMAKRASLRSAREVLGQDRRPPVLFLRDFKNDQVSLESAVLPPYARLFDPGMERANLEEVLQSCLSLGPVIALGRPEDALPPIGASRTYVNDETWREVVVSQMDAASLIVVDVSESKGLSWEIDQLVRRNHLMKSVFVILPQLYLDRHLLSCLLVRLLRLDTENSQVTVALKNEIGDRKVAGVILCPETAKVFVSQQRLSQIQYDIMIRFAELDW